jgi:hypothetical protein
MYLFEHRRANPMSRDDHDYSHIQILNEQVNYDFNSRKAFPEKFFST